MIYNVTSILIFCYTVVTAFPDKEKSEGRNKRFPQIQNVMGKYFNLVIQM